MENKKRKNQRTGSSQDTSPNQLVRNWIRFSLKENGLTYSECAKVLGVSLATMKRLMTQSDFTLSQVSKISDWLRVSVPDLIGGIPAEPTILTEFSPKQEAFLVKNPQTFYALIVVMKGGGPREISTELQVSTPEAKKMIFQLDRLNLVKIFPGDRFRVTSMGPFKWQPGGALEKEFLRKFHLVLGHNAQETIFNGSSLTQQKEDSFLKPFEFYLKSKTLLEFQQKVKTVVEEFHKRAIVEADTTHYSELLPISGIVLISKFNAWKQVLDDSNGA